MFKTALAVVMLAACSFAATDPGEYSIEVHVSSSRWMMETGLGGDARPVQLLTATVDRKQIVLQAPAALRVNFQAGVTLLNPGDYKAKLVVDEHNNTYESSQAYEFLFPDKKTRKFVVIEKSE
jgi:hypothetical protein